MLVCQAATGLRLLHAAPVETAKHATSVWGVNDKQDGLHKCSRQQLLASALRASSNRRGFSVSVQVRQSWVAVCAPFWASKTSLCWNATFACPAPSWTP